LKKTLSLLVGIVLMLMLAACNQTAEPVDTNEEVTETDATQVEEETQDEEETVSELTLSEVLERSTAASDSLDSFAVQMDLQQEMSGVENLSISSVIDMKAVTKPMAIHQKMNMEVPGSSEQVETELYFTEDGIYMLQPMGEGWMKLPTELSDQVMQSSPQQSNPAEELKKLQKFVDDFTFEQDENSYILTLSASGDKFQEFIDDAIQQSLTPEMTEGMDVTSDMKINKVDYQITIDKETFYPSTLNMNMDMDITVDGETIHLVQKMNGKYTEYNQINEITVPQEVIDSAAEINM
jgi:hypothetical protein